MNRNYKYQDLFYKYGLMNTCPDTNIAPINMEAFRWSHSPIDHELNFLPVSIYKELNNSSLAPVRINTSVSYTCSSCSLSMFISMDQALNHFNGFPSRVQKLLGYTHIAKGVLDENDGVISAVNAIGHFDLFEFENINLSIKFFIVAPLN